MSTNIAYFESEHALALRQASDIRTSIARAGHTWTEKTLRRALRGLAKAEKRERDLRHRIDSLMHD